MAVETAFAAWIGAKAPVSAIVGAAIHAEQAPQKAARPFLIYTLVDGDRLYHAGGSAGLVTSSIEITCAGRKYNESSDLYEAIRNEVDGFQGAWGGVAIRRATITPPRSGNETAAEAAANGLNALKATIEVIHREALPVRT